MFYECTFLQIVINKKCSNEKYYYHTHIFHSWFSKTLYPKTDLCCFFMVVNEIIPISFSQSAKDS